MSGYITRRADEERIADPESCLSCGAASLPSLRSVYMKNHTVVSGEDVVGC